ncbi:MAG: PrsW family intramembrane metalloprotease [Bacteroidales bacterium]|nr:PrsW family intramembrane metalloprotease [Bacteroidales bacterium]
MLIILTASLLPVVVLLVYIYRKDQYQKEPLPLLLKALLGGALAGIMDIALLTLLRSFEVTTFASPMHHALYQAFCQAALPEELCKLFFLYLFIWNSKYFDEYYDGLEYAACVGLGFAGLENFMYVLEGGIAVAVGRALFAVPAHFFFAIFMGYFFALAKFRRNKKHTYLFLAFIVPVILHGIYDFILMYNDFIQQTNTAVASLLNLVFYIFFIFVWKIAARRINTMSGQ